MIQLHHECLLLDNGSGQLIPFFPESLTVEILDPGSGLLDEDLVREAAAAVVHYFRHEVGRETVSAMEFSTVLANVLRELGIPIQASTPSGSAAAEASVWHIDLTQLAAQAGEGFELAFFQLLREALASPLRSTPTLLRCKGLRDCVKHLLGARRWGGRCERLSDLIVATVRQCLSQRPTSVNRAVVVA
jgi:hypothetical protein